MPTGQKEDPMDEEAPFARCDAERGLSRRSLLQRAGLLGLGALGAHFGSGAGAPCSVAKRLDGSRSLTLNRLPCRLGIQGSRGALRQRPPHDSPKPARQSPRHRSGKKGWWPGFAQPESCPATDPGGSIQRLPNTAMDLSDGPASTLVPSLI